MSNVNKKIKNRLNVYGLCCGGRWWRKARTHRSITKRKLIYERYDYNILPNSQKNLAFGLHTPTLHNTFKYNIL